MINQLTVDYLFNHMMNNEGIIDYQWDEIVLIKQTLKETYDITISTAEAVNFWKWRSEVYCASWLGNNNKNDVIEWFQKYYDRFYDGDDEIKDYTKPWR